MLEGQVRTLHCQSMLTVQVTGYPSVLKGSRLAKEHGFHKDKDAVAAIVKLLPEAERDNQGELCTYGYLYEPAS